MAKWGALEAAAARAIGKKPMRSCKFDFVLDGGPREVAKHTRREFDESDDE